MQLNPVGQQGTAGAFRFDLDGDGVADREVAADGNGGELMHRFPTTGTFTVTVTAVAADVKLGEGNDFLRSFRTLITADMGAGHDRAVAVR
ncbi:MAG: hypothetical protein KatS3mg105_5181 [Gemmatales bacterium]|nr:MAG: hypothetical protein KatS3mg105_5181 [Gemmatales bacterium]